MDDGSATTLSVYPSPEHYLVYQILLRVAPLSLSKALLTSLVLKLQESEVVSLLSELGCLPHNSASWRALLNESFYASTMTEMDSDVPKRSSESSHLSRRSSSPIRALEKTQASGVSDQYGGASTVATPEHSGSQAGVQESLPGNALPLGKHCDSCDGHSCPDVG